MKIIKIEKQSTHTHKELVEISYRWLLKNGCGTAFKELCTANNEIPDAIGFGAWRSVLVECKISRSDFLKDKKKRHRVHPEKGMGMYRFYICPTGMIKKDELPEGWGLIYVSPKGRATTVYNPYSPKGGNMWLRGFENYNIEAEQRLMYSALRRIHLKGDMDKIYDKDYQYSGGLVRNV